MRLLFYVGVSASEIVNYIINHLMVILLYRVAEFLGVGRMQLTTSTCVGECTEIGFVFLYECVPAGHKLGM